MARTSNIPSSAPRALPGGGNTIVRTFSRTCAKPLIAALTTNDVLGTMVFALSDLPNYTEFTSLFDQYRIIEVEVRFIPYAGNSACGPYGYSKPDLLVVADYDDATPPATTAGLLQYENLQIVHGNAPLTVRVRPHAALAAYSGAFTSYANVEHMWMDSGSPNVQHYGVKYSLTQAQGATDLSTYQPWATYKIACRNTI